MKIDYVHFYVDDTQKWRDWFSTRMNFSMVAGGHQNHNFTEVITNGNIVFVLSSPTNVASPVAKYLQTHPCGVGDVAFNTNNLTKVLQQAIGQGAKLLTVPQQKNFPQGTIKWCQIINKSGLHHTLYQREGLTPIFPQLKGEQIYPTNFTQGNFTGIDHIVLNVAAGELRKTAAWYEKALGFQARQNFDIKTENSGLYSQVMVHPESGVKIPINEPASSNSQIQEFLDINQGAGIQHIALQTPHIANTTAQFRKAGLTFLPVLKRYYTQLSKRIPPLSLEKEELAILAAQQILIDCQQKTNTCQRLPLLLQIFTKPIFYKPTFFFELIERRDNAEGFGEGNFRALFEAMEQEQLKRGSLY